MIITLTISGVILIILIIGRINLHIKFDKEVKELFTQSGNISDKIFNHQQLYDLPEPVQRYFNYVLKTGQPYIRFARIKHDGQFKTGLNKDWISIKGEQYATTGKPGFIWKGTTSLFTARDMYIAGKGRLIVSLLSVFNIVDGKGETFNQGELLRWLGESVLYPTNLLPDERLQWIAIDFNSAKLIFNYNSLSLFFIITVNEIGEITQMVSRRYMNKEKMETWVIKMSDYKEMNKVTVPSVFEVLWRLERGDFSYAKFNILKVEYDIPRKF